MSGHGPSSIYEFGDFHLDAAQRLLRSKDGRPVPLTPRVFDTLLHLVEHAGQLIGKPALMEAIWPHVVVEEGSLSQAIYELRRALGERPDEHRFIVTVPGRGYQFVGDVVRRDRASAVWTQPTEAPALEPPASTNSSPVELSAPHPSAASPSVEGPCAPDTPMWRRAFLGTHTRYVAAVLLAAGAVAAWYGAGVRATDPSAQRLGSTRPAVATVAVLPFVDLSSERGQQYFSEGLSEELIHLLAQRSSLRVVARTSSFSFKGHNVDIATIAGKLGATHVVEGSVRKSGERMRIAVQLVDGATSSHIWSQTYDRPVDDALAVQQEIASSIATSLNATLAGDRRATVPTADARAYEHFLLARYFFSRRQQGDIGRAEQAYRRALELDPDFARAWAGLAGVYYVSSDRYDILGLPRDEALARLRQAAEKALALDPNLAEAHVRRAMHRSEIGDRAGAREQARFAAALDPNNPLVLGWLATNALFEGRPNEAVDLQRRAVLRDPLTLVARANLGTSLYFAGRYDEATNELRTALQLAGAPDGAWDNSENTRRDAAVSLAKTLLASRRFDEAFALIQSWPDGQYRDQCLALLHHALGNAGEADAAFGRLIASATTEPHWVAETYAHRGNIDQAFRWLATATNRNRANGDTWQVWRLDIRYSPFTTSLHPDGRWKAWLAESSGER